MLSAKGEKAINTALNADLVVLNTAVAGKWLDGVLKDKVSQVLPKVLWWIHEMRGHYFKLEYVKHLPFVAGAMIDSYTTAEYWKNRTRERLGYIRSLLCVVNCFIACWLLALKFFLVLLYFVLDMLCNWPLFYLMLALIPSFQCFISSCLFIV